MMEKLLKIAKEKYPVGTVFKSAYTQDEKDVENCEISENNGDLFVNNGFACIYYKGIWAEIISKPKVKEDMSEFLGLPKEETMTLLEQAKKRFSIGTKFVPAHINEGDGHYCIIVEEGEFSMCEDGEEVLQTLNGEYYDNTYNPKYGNTKLNRVIYYQGKWARIIEEPKTRIVESLNECKAEDPLTNISSVTDPYADFVPGTTQTVRTFGQIKEDDFFERAYASICKMQQAKNKKYGESALSDKFNLFDGKTKLAPRLNDKLNRVDNSPVLIKNDISDLIGYLMLVCKENNWDNFEDLID